METEFNKKIDTPKKLDLNNASAFDEKPTSKQDFMLRAESEDDDGYDPYSDRREHTPLFESDPWK